VVVEYSSFNKFLGKNLRIEKVRKIFERLPKIVIKGDVNMPYFPSPTGWMKLENYTDNICGVLEARETTEFEQYRSDR